jgi:ubiquitin-like domain-containing CTD phosphatase 1
MWTWDNVLDCLMTTVCTGRDVPGGSLQGDGAVMTQALFDQAVNQSTLSLSMLYLANNSQYAKLGTGNTAWHMRRFLESVLLNQTALNSSTSTTPIKLAVFSGHDTTVMPLLAAILGDNWDGLWASYASYVTVEVYASRASPANSSTDLFRIVYNGVPQLVPGCEDSLCSVDVLLEALSFGQEFMPCSLGPDQQSTPTGTDDQPSGDSCSNNGGLSATAWSLLIVLGLFCGAFVGAAVVVFAIKHNYPLSNDNSDSDSNAIGFDSKHAKNPLV